jgi:hypothetical protein
MNAIPMIGQCMRYQQETHAAYNMTIIAWTPDLFVQTDRWNSPFTRVPLLMLKLDGPTPLAQER